jgi:hypothetical protein
MGPHLPGVGDCDNDVDPKVSQPVEHYAVGSDLGQFKGTWNRNFNIHSSGRFTTEEANDLIRQLGLTDSDQLIDCQVLPATIFRCMSRFRPW